MLLIRLIIISILLLLLLLLLLMIIIIIIMLMMMIIIMPPHESDWAPRALRHVELGGPQESFSFAPFLVQRIAVVIRNNCSTKSREQLQVPFRRGPVTHPEKCFGQCAMGV